MKEFHSMAEFGIYLGVVVLEERAAEQESLKKVGKIVEERAKEKIGHYQGASGYFAAWPELSEFTKADRASRGFSEDDPLWRWGFMRDSIGHSVGNGEVSIGSPMKEALWQELGTADAAHPIPARSFLGGALFDKVDEVVDAIGEGAVSVLVGGASFVRLAHR